MSKLSHIDENDRPTMVDVGDKTATSRSAHARTVVRLPEDVASQFSGDEIRTKKGPVFATAIVAGVMAAKRAGSRTWRCPTCCAPCVHHKTGVEMEALTGASVAALTIYDMLKALSHDIVIGDTRLMAKSGGKRDFKRDDQATDA